MLKYKGYTGHVEYDDEAQIFHGTVLGLKDGITFQGTTVEEIQREFRTSIDVYLEWCKERGEVPEKSFSGKIHVRVNPDLHANLSIEAAKRGISLNELISQRLSESNRKNKGD